MPPGREFSLVRAGARVRVTEAVDDANGLALFVGADVRLSELPKVDEDGQVEVPAEPRRLTEKAIDAAANLLSVATGHARSVTSRNLPVAFYAENDQDREFLHAQTGIKSIDRGVSFSRMSVFVIADELTALQDRERGTELLAERCRSTTSQAGTASCCGPSSWRSRRPRAGPCSCLPSSLRSGRGSATPRPR